MSDYALHPEAYIDIDEIREYIAEEARTLPTGW